MGTHDTTPPAGDYFAGFIPVPRAAEPSEVSGPPDRPAPDAYDRPASDDYDRPASDDYDRPASAPTSATPVSSYPVSSYPAPVSAEPQSAPSYPGAGPSASPGYPVAGRPDGYPTAGYPPAASLPATPAGLSTSYPVVPSQPTSSPAFPSQPTSSPAFPSLPAASPSVPSQPAAFGASQPMTYGPSQPITYGASQPAAPNQPMTYGASQPAAYPAAPGQSPAYPAVPGQPAAPAGYAGSPSLYPSGSVVAPSPFGGTVPGYPTVAPAPVVAAAGPRGRRGRVLVAITLALLLVVAGGQAYALVKTNGRLDAANRDRARADAAADARISALSTRATQLESQLKAQLDPVGVAAKIAPAVWEIDAGDFLGTAWAVRKSPGGGTDLITNYHVVESTYKTGDKHVALVRDKQRINATVVKAVPGNDVVLVHVSQDLPVLTVDTTAVVPGEAVLAEGTPLGWQSSVSTGVVSNVNRRVRTPHGYVTFFQFDAAINPGNSGGPVVNAGGDVVGIASAVFIDTENHVPAQSMSLAIPIGTACKALSAC